MVHLASGFDKQNILVVIFDTHYSVTINQEMWWQQNFRSNDFTFTTENLLLSDHYITNCTGCNVS